MEKNIFCTVLSINSFASLPLKNWLNYSSKTQTQINLMTKNWLYIHLANESLFQYLKLCGSSN